MPAAADQQQQRELTLSPDTYLFLQNEGKGGLINIYKGPTVVNQTGQDRPVRYDANQRKYHQCSLDQAVQNCPHAAEGDYVIVENPTEDGTFPKDANNSSKALKKGRKIVIPGPWSEALYPGQSATVVPGHRLRSNQYIVAIIYNSEEAEKQWDTSVVRPQQQQTEGIETKPETKTDAPKKGLPKPDSYAVGTRIVIKGSDVSFYIPCTGVEVLREEKPSSKDKEHFVRDAVTLEQLEYCCLVDESGKKEYPRGPKVVFPKPTQIFEEDSQGRRKFRPLELNTINGIHLKVTANFEDEDIEQPIDETGKRPARKYVEGTELFVTGKTLQIYYPREELAIIEYGKGLKKHYSTAIPKGEGRYVINRETGVIRLEKGPKMYLADPRTEIPVRRVLGLDDCSLWYPGNKEAVAYNQALAETMTKCPSGRSNLVSEGDWRKATEESGPAMEAFRSMTDESIMASSMAFSAPATYSQESVGEEGGATSITRGTRYTPPRTLTLNTKYDGAPRINVFSGFAVLVVGADGARRVVKGPEFVLLEYHERLGFMELSTGKPKSTDTLMKTAYLSVQNNQVGDIVSFESRDHVRCKVKISLRVNFEAETPDDELKWFGVDNYVKYLTDHVRSILAGMGKRHSIAEIKDKYVDLVREAILGPKPIQATQDQSTSLRSSRPGLYFPDNGMRVFEVEVLDLELNDNVIAKMLTDAQVEVVSSNIKIARAQKDLETTKEQNRIAQEKMQAEHATATMQITLQKKELAEQLSLNIAELEAELAKIEQGKVTISAQEACTDLKYQSELARAQKKADQEISVEARRQELASEKLDKETASAVARFAAAKDGLYEVLVALQREDLATRLANAVNIERYVSGEGLGAMGTFFNNVLTASPALKNFFEKTDGMTDARNRLKSESANR